MNQMYLEHCQKQLMSLKTMENCCRCTTNRKITWKSRTESLHGALCCFALDGSSHVNSLHKTSKAKQKLSELSNTEIQEAYGSIIEACGSLWKIQKHLEAVAG